MDKYDKQIDQIMKERWRTVDEWGSAIGLFQYCSADGSAFHLPYAGCLTMIRRAPGLFKAQTPELSEEIARDERLPRAVSSNTTREQLEVMAEWQRRLDKEIRNKSERG